MTDTPTDHARSTSLRTLRRGLWSASLIYLAVPVLIFCVGWLRPVIGVPFALLIAAGIAWWLRGLWRDDARGDQDTNSHSVALDGDTRVPNYALLFAALPTLLVLLICGAGGWGPQVHDWLKHNAILADLAQHDWPVTYHTTKGPLTLVYYVGYYLPAAVVARTLGWTAGNHALWLTTVIGLMLALGWVITLTRGRRPVICGLIFVAFSGMDVLGHLIVPLIIGQPLLSDPWSHIEWWSGVSALPSHVTAVFWTPQHAITAWIGGGMCLDAVLTRDIRFPGVLLVAMAMLWSTLIAIGLIPLVLYQWCVRRGSIPQRLRSIASPLNVVGLLVALMLVTFYLQRFVPYDLPPRYDVANPIPNGFIPLLVPAERLWMILLPYAIFVVVEFGVLIGVCLAADPDDDQRRLRRGLLIVCLAFMAIMPLFRYGYFNDLAMRTSMPMLFIVAVMVCRIVASWPARRWAVITLTVVLCVGMITPLIEARRHIRTIVESRRWLATPRPQEVDTLFELQLKITPQFDLLRQYVGSTDSFFYRYLGGGDADAPPPRDGLIATTPARVER